MAMTAPGNKLALISSIQEFYPALSTIDAGAAEILLRHVSPLVMEKGAEVFAPGQVCQGYLLLSQGVIRVQSVSKEGREALLYRVYPGEICIQTSLSLLSEETYTAEAVCESDSVGLLLNPVGFDELLAQSPVFRRFVFSSIALRLRDMTQTVERIAFEPIDVRLAHVLLKRQDWDGVVRATHQDLARDLGTAREVVSRHLDRMAQRGMVQTSRGSIRLANIEALARMASS